MAASVAMMAPATAPVAHAFDGGATQRDAVELPCAVPCSFLGDNTGDGLSAFPVDTAANEHATWWTFQAGTTTSHTVRATGQAPTGWRSTLVLTDLDGNVLAADDDPYGRDAVLTATLAEGNWYLLALAGHDADAQGTALIDVATGTPDAPVDVTAAPRTGAALLAWTEPDDHGDAIAEYRVYVDGSSTYTAVPAPASSTTVAGLTIGTPVSFQVTAVNTAGESARSTSTDAVVPYGPTTTTVAFSPTSVTYPGTFDVVATVTAAVTVDQGVVTFWRNGTKLTDVSVVSGTATLTNQTLNPGTYSYGAYFSGSAVFLASSKTDSITVSKTPQELTFAPIADTELAVGTFTVAPSSTGPVAITVVSTTTAVCTVKNKVVTLVATGSCSLTAAQAGNTLYAAATSVTRAFTVLDTPTTTTAAPTTTTNTTTTTTEPPTTTTEPPTTTTTSTSTTSTTTTTTTEPPTTSSTTTEPTSTSSSTTTSSTSTTTTTTTEPTSTSSSTTTAAPTTTEPATSTSSTSTTTTTPATTTTPSTTTTTAPAPSGEAAFQGVVPRRIAAPTAPLRAGQVLAVRVIGPNGPTTVDAVNAVTVRLTVTPTGFPGHVVAYPCGTVPPRATLSFEARRALVATVLVQPDPLAGRICVVVDHAAGVHVDLLGWSSPRGAVHPVRPVRLFDTRDGSGVRTGTHRLAAGSVLRVRATGIGGQVPASGVSAVVAHVTVVRTNGRGSLLAWSCGTRPTGATVLFPADGVATSMAVVPVDARTGDVCVAASVGADVVLDVAGWIAAERGVTFAPRHLVDTRPGKPAAAPVHGAIGANPTVVRLHGLLPQGTTLAVVTVAATGAERPGTLTIRSCATAPTAVGPGTLTFAAGGQAGATVLLPVVGDAAAWCLTSTGRGTHVTIDLIASVAPPPT